MCTGAGGSIGSELCRQILNLEPQALVPVLGNAAEAALVQHAFAAHGVQVVCHAAAYKHVPLVEANPLAGLANNVGATRAVCSAAARAGLHKEVLISTDKAVSPCQPLQRRQAPSTPGQCRHQHALAG